jgi:hypothetical protein
MIFLQIAAGVIAYLAIITVILSILSGNRIGEDE